MYHNSMKVFFLLYIVLVNHNVIYTKLSIVQMLELLLIISIIRSKISNSDENSIRVVTFLKIHNNPEISLKVLEDGILC